MNISFILSSLWLSGGVRVVIQYANRLSKRGHHISIIVPNGTVDENILREIEQGIKVIQTKNSITDKRNPFQLLRITWEMAKVVPESDVIIATHTPTTMVSLIAGKLFRKGKMIWFYQDYIEMFEKRPVERWLLRHALRWHDLSLTISEVCVQELLSFSPGNVINVGEGIDTTDIFHPIKTNGPLNQGLSEKKVIFSIGDSRPRKGIFDFLKACEKVYEKNPDLVLWIASKEKIDLPTTLPFELIYSPEPDQLARLYSACDVFVSASWYESFGLPPLEAMACGAAVVTTDSRGVCEYAVNGENCLLVPPQDPDALAKAILFLLDNPEFAEKLKENGPITAARFNWESATNRFESALFTLIRKNQAGLTNI